MIFLVLGKMQCNVKGDTYNSVPWIENIDSRIFYDTQCIIQETATETDQN